MGDRRVCILLIGDWSITDLKQPYFMAEAEAGVIFPRRACQVDEVVSGIIYLMENSMMNDFELRIDGGTRGSSNWGGPIDREWGSAI